jgi:hypothetical protein
MFTYHDQFNNFMNDSNARSVQSTTPKDKENDSDKRFVAKTVPLDV